MATLMEIRSDLRDLMNKDENGEVDVQQRRKLMQDIHNALQDYEINEPREPPR